MPAPIRPPTEPQIYLRTIPGALSADQQLQLVGFHFIHFNR